METKIFLILIVLQVCHLCSGAVLQLAGRVPDRGFEMSAAKIELVKNTEMKIYVAGKNSEWRKVAKPEFIKSDSMIRIQAP